jgi:hypothetical protein
MTRWWRIDGRYFVAGLRVEGGTVVEAAPILAWTVGRVWTELRAHFRRRGWHGEPL